jgi:ATP-binding cassette subfamily C protein CydD
VYSCPISGDDGQVAFMRRLLTLARDSRLALAVTVLSGVLIGFLVIGQARILSQVVSTIFISGGKLLDVAGLLKILVIVIFLRALLVWGGEVTSKAVAVQVKSDLRNRLYKKLLDLGPSFTRDERTGELVNTAVEGVESLDAYFSQYLPQVAISALVPMYPFGSAH